MLVCVCARGKRNSIASAARLAESACRRTALVCLWPKSDFRDEFRPSDGCGGCGDEHYDRVRRKLSRAELTTCETELRKPSASLLLSAAAAAAAAKVGLKLNCAAGAEQALRACFKLVHLIDVRIVCVRSIKRPLVGSSSAPTRKGPQLNWPLRATACRPHRTRIDHNAISACARARNNNNIISNGLCVARHH